MTLYLLLGLMLFGAAAFLFWPLKTSRSISVCGIFCLAAFGLYQWLGAPHIVPVLEAREERLVEIGQSITKHAARVKNNPRDLESWITLGGNFMEVGQYAAASNAFKQAVLLSGGDPLLIFAYAKSMIIDADGTVNDEAKKALEMTLLQEPQHDEARYWLIVRKLQDGKSDEAMAEMKALYQSLPDGAALKEMIDQQIGRN